MSRFLERLETKWGVWVKDANELLKVTKQFQFLHFDVPNKQVSLVTLQPETFEPEPHLLPFLMPPVDKASTHFPVQ